jgi:hypothetical protein
MRKTILILLVLTVGVLAALRVGLYVYDSRTTNELTELAAAELSPGASKGAMEAFMQRNTIAYHVDETIDFRYGGMTKQSELDKLFFDRKVAIFLMFDPKTKAYKNIQVSIQYTFL